MERSVIIYYTYILILFIKYIIYTYGTIYR
jgi:hypothetical protein